MWKANFESIIRLANPKLQTRPNPSNGSNLDSTLIQNEDYLLYK